MLPLFFNFGIDNKRIDRVPPDYNLAGVIRGG